MANVFSLRPAAQDAISRLSHLVQERPVRFATPNLGDAQTHLRAQHDSIVLKVGDPRGFRGYRELHLPPLRSVGLTLGCIDAAGGYELSFRSGDEMLVNIPLCGRGWVDGGSRTLEMAAGQILLVGPACHVTKHWQGPGRVLSLHIPLSTLDGVLPLYLPPITLIDHGRLHTLLSFIDLLVQDNHAGPGPLGDEAVAAHAERLLLALLLEGLQMASSPSPQPSGKAAPRPYHVRRAEDHMRANAALDLNIDELAAAVGVSVRTLQYGFRKALGVSPMQHFKRIRLELAREALRSAGQQQRRVGEVAASNGFNNVSQFSRDYRALFGETPSDTVATLHRLCVPAPDPGNRAWVSPGPGLAPGGKPCAGSKAPGAAGS